MPGEPGAIEWTATEDADFLRAIADDIEANEAYELDGTDAEEFRAIASRLSARERRAAADAARIRELESVCREHHDWKTRAIDAESKSRMDADENRRLWARVREAEANAKVAEAARDPVFVGWLRERRDCLVGLAPLATDWLAAVNAVLAATADRPGAGGGEQSA